MYTPVWVAKEHQKFRKIGARWWKRSVVELSEHDLYVFTGEPWKWGQILNIASKSIKCLSNNTADLIVIELSYIFRRHFIAHKNLQSVCKHQPKLPFFFFLRLPASFCYVVLFMYDVYSIHITVSWFSAIYITLIKISIWHIL